MKWIKIGIASFVLFAIAGIGYDWMSTTGRDRPDPSVSARDGSAEPLSLHFLISGPPTARLPEAKDDFVKLTIERKFNVKLKVTAMPPGDEYNETIAAMLAANDPPDMWLNISPDGGAKYTLDNVLADMTYFVTKETMPNYFTYWMNEKELRGYQVHNKFARAPIPYDPQSYRAYYIRKDWLTRLGLEIPGNYEEYLQVLKAFTIRDPDGNGKPDTYGFTASGNGTSISLDWPEYVHAGLIYPAYLENGKLIDMQMDVRVGQVADRIVQLMQVGWVDPDWFLNQGNQHMDKAVQGKAGVLLGETRDFAFDSNPDSLQSRSKAINPLADWVPFNPFGRQALRTAVSPSYPFVFSNNAAGLRPEKLKKTAQILDWLAGEEGFLLTHYGVEGKHYTRAGHTITLKPDVVERDIQAKGDFLKIWSFFTPETPGILGLSVLDARVTERDQKIERMLTSIPVHPGLGATLTPPLGVSVEKMRARQTELQVRMIFSDRSGYRWPEYRNEVLSVYGGESIIRYYEEKIREAQKQP